MSGRLTALLVACVAALAMVSPSAPVAAAVGHASTRSAGPSDPAGSIGSLAQRSNVPGLTTRKFMTHFVRRHGSRLYVDGHRFRFSGGNAEWLGLANYGPEASKSIPLGFERFPSHYEIDDAFATLHEMGATVVRVQTLGDSIGCSLCLEPRLGHFSRTAFRHLDWMIADARAWGIKLIGEFSGDDGGADSSTLAQSTDFYCRWEHAAVCGLASFAQRNLRRDYERHMRVVLNHVNAYTHLAYKNDPTIVGWVDGNNLNLKSEAPQPVFEKWLSKVSSYFKTIDKRQLFIDVSVLGGDAAVSPSALKIPGVDVYGQEYYPHWFPVVQGGLRSGGAAPSLHAEAKQIAAVHKAYATVEWGWDHTDFTTVAALRQFLGGLLADPDVSGEGFWALTSHGNGQGWQPIPANMHCQPTCEGLEDGNWWALYYTGRTTDSNTAADMAIRAQVIRHFGYRLDGFRRVPRHERVPAPVVTAVSGNRIFFEGAAGSPNYSVQRRMSNGWRTVCHHCVTDSVGDWRWKVPGGCFRIRGFNLGGQPGPFSRPAGECKQPQDAAVAPSVR